MDKKTKLKQICKLLAISKYLFNALSIWLDWLYLNVSITLVDYVTPDPVYTCMRTIDGLRCTLIIMAP